MENIGKTVREYIIDNFLFEDDQNFKETTSFLENGIIDSTGILEMVTFIEDTFEVTVEDEEMIPENLDSIAAYYIGKEDWLKIKKQAYDEAREALIGKKRDHIAIKEVLHKFSENAKAENESKSFITDEIIVTGGTPEEIILEQAAERDCDLIVMGSHGQGALADAVIGSTARRVIRRSKKPVFVVPLSKEV